jgi:prophage pi2 protein 43
VSYAKLVYRGRSSEDFGAKITYPLNIVQPKRNVTATSVSGVNGDFLMDSKNYGNIQQPINMLVEFPKGYKDWTEWFMEFCDWLQPQDRDRTSYEEWQLSMLEPYRFIGYVADPPTISISNSILATVNFTLTVKPFVMQYDGLIWRDVPQTVINHEQYSSQPTFHIVGSGDFILMINDLQYKLTNIDDEVYIDSENCLVYKSKTQNRANCVSFPNNDFPELTSGVNKISLSGNYSKFEYQAKWRRKL